MSALGRSPPFYPRLQARLRSELVSWIVSELVG
jgi:hypothetical protein